MSRGYVCHAGCEAAGVTDAAFGSVECIIFLEVFGA